MARELDYVAPMVYPSHWNTGEYDVADPNAAALPDRPALAARLQARPSRAPARGSCPGSRTSRSASTYGPAQVRAQIDAARSDGINEFLLWDPGVVYDGAGLTPNARPQRASRVPASG